MLNRICGVMHPGRAGGNLQMPGYPDTPNPEAPLKTRIQEKSALAIRRQSSKR
ncbi:MAG: hypothetical protein WAX67_08620 [Rugosibacter sp.]